MAHTPSTWIFEKCALLDRAAASARPDPKAPLVQQRRKQTWSGEKLKKKSGSSAGL
jgi:hypothetical protein